MEDKDIIKSINDSNEIINPVKIKHNILCTLCMIAVTVFISSFIIVLSSNIIGRTSVVYFYELNKNNLNKEFNSTIEVDKISKEISSYMLRRTKDLNYEMYFDGNYVQAFTSTDIIVFKNLRHILDIAFIVSLFLFILAIFSYIYLFNTNRYKEIKLSLFTTAGLTLFFLILIFITTVTNGLSFLVKMFGIEFEDASIWHYLFSEHFKLYSYSFVAIPSIIFTLIFVYAVYRINIFSQKRSFLS